jgi:RNA polymerase sigma-70 factor (ECF subfamily)
MGVRVGLGRTIPVNIGTRAAPEFDEVFLVHYRSTVRVLCRLVGNTARAEELADDLFLRLYRRPLPPGKSHNMGAWLYRAAVRLGLNELTASTRRRNRENAAPAPNPVHGPLEQMLKEERAANVRATLAGLKRKHAELLTLHASDLSYGEIADAMRINPSSVGTLLKRAKQAFEREYRARFGEEPPHERR